LILGHLVTESYLGIGRPAYWLIGRPQDPWLGATRQNATLFQDQC
jgi:hypothetical protein